MKHGMKLIGAAALVVTMSTVSAGAATLVSTSFGVDKQNAPLPDNWFDVGSQNLTNDCPNFFGDNGFDTCDIGNPLVDMPEISDSIAKFNTDGTGWEVNSSYPDDIYERISLFNLNSPTPDTPTEDVDTGQGGWEYDPAVGDPFIRFWAAKQQDGFRLYWMVEDLAASGCLGGDDKANYVQSCVDAAVAVTSGEWNFGNGLSHITFYNHGEYTCEDLDDCNPPVDFDIPVPAGLPLVLTGLGVMGVLRAKKRKQA